MVGLQHPAPKAYGHHAALRSDECFCALIAAGSESFEYVYTESGAPDANRREFVDEAFLPRRLEGKGLMIARNESVNQNCAFVRLNVSALRTIMHTM